MNIDLPNDPAMAFKQGWTEALNEVMYTLNRLQDPYRMPETKRDQDRLTQIEGMKRIISNHLDIQATIAAVQERENRLKANNAVNEAAAAEIRNGFEP